MERLSMSLDDLIAQKDQGKNKSKNRNTERRNGGNGNNRNENKPKISFGAAKRNNDHSRDDRKSEPYVRREVEVKQPLTYRPIRILGGNEDGNRNTTAAPSSTSVFDRLGKAPAVSGTCVLFDNLKKTVDGSDLQELCGVVGELKEIEVHKFGSAKVWFSRRSDALTCVAKFDGLTLDGLVMAVSLANEPAPSKSVFDRLKPAGPKNVKEGIFGVSIDDNEDDEQIDSFGRGGNGPTFQVTLGGDRREQRSERPVSSNGHRQVREDRGNGRQQSTSFKSSGGRGAGAPRRNGGGRSDRGDRTERAPKKDVNLDDDLDAYMSSR